MPAAKCKYCQTSLKTSEAYKENIKNKTMYFCNEDHFERYMKDLKVKQRQKEYDKQLQDKFYKLFCNILGVNGITNTALWKEKAEINKVFSDEIIIAYLEEHKEYLTNMVSKLDGGIYGKIRYVSVVLRNRLGDYKPKAKEIKIETQKQESVEMRDDFGIRTNNKKKITRRKGFSEMEG